MLVTKQPNVKGWANINSGVSLIDGWPDGVTLQFSDDNPEGVLLTDHITNIRSWLIVGEKFKHSLDELDLEYLEFLPVGFLDHKGRKKEGLYWIVNFTKLLPAVNREESEYGDGIDGTLDFFEKLIITDEVEKSGPPIFCLEEQPTLFLFREDYKEEIEKLGLTGFRLVPSDEFRD